MQPTNIQRAQEAAVQIVAQVIEKPIDPLSAIKSVIRTIRVFGDVVSMWCQGPRGQMAKLAVNQCIGHGIGIGGGVSLSWAASSMKGEGMQVIFGLFAAPFILVETLNIIVLIDLFREKCCGKTSWFARPQTPPPVMG